MTTKLASWRHDLNPLNDKNKTFYYLPISQREAITNVSGLAEIRVSALGSHSCLTGVTAAELRRHLSNMNVIFHR